MFCSLGISWENYNCIGSQICVKASPLYNIIELTLIVHVLNKILAHVKILVSKQIKGIIFIREYKSVNEPQLEQYYYT